MVKKIKNKKRPQFKIWLEPPKSLGRPASEYILFFLLVSLQVNRLGD